MSEKLKMCPFCGGEVKITSSAEYEVSFIECTKCYARVNWYDKKLRKSKIDIEAWNRRASE